MNVLETGPRYDFRKIESRSPGPKPETAVQRQDESQTRLSLASANVKLSATTTNPKYGDSNQSLKENRASDDIAETADDETINKDSTDWPDDPGDLANDRELAEESAEEQDEQTEEQRQRKTRRLDKRESHSRSQFIALNHLLDRLAAVQALLTRQTGNHSQLPNS